MVVHYLWTGGRFEAAIRVLECCKVTNWSLESVYSYAEPVPANQPLPINTANNQHNQVTASPQQTVENTTQQSNTSTTPLWISALH